jgi:peroxiredoxin
MRTADTPRFTAKEKNMARCAIVALLVAVFAMTSPVQGGKYNRKLKIDDAAPVFKGLEGIDDKKHNLDEFKNKDLVVVVFTCNECPVSRAYEKRIIAFTKKHEGKVAVVAINVNQGEEETLAQMKERAKKMKFNFAYLRDPSQKIGHAYGASKTPEFFVLNKDRKIAYMGALDDEMIERRVEEKYLDKAIEAVLKGQKPATAETPALGCSIEYKK